MSRRANCVPSIDLWPGQARNSAAGPSNFRRIYFPNFAQAEMQSRWMLRTKRVACSNPSDFLQAAGPQQNLRPALRAMPRFFAESKLKPISLLLDCISENIELFP